MATTRAAAAEAENFDSPSLAVPLHVDSDWTVRVARTRVTLETLVGTFDQGATPEEIGRRFPVVRIEDVYAVVAYYLAHREAVQDYIQRQEEAGEAIRHEIESHTDTRVGALGRRSQATVDSVTPAS